MEDSMSGEDLRDPVRRRPDPARHNDRSRYELVLAHGYVQVRRIEPDYVGRRMSYDRAFWKRVAEEEIRAEHTESPDVELDDGGSYQYAYESPEAEVAAGLRVDRGREGVSDRSLLLFRKRLRELRLEAFERPILITLTYPGEWGRYCPDGRALEGHRRRFAKQWERRWGKRPVGVWVKEFQERGSPHLHLYLSLPAGVSDANYEGLRRRTVLMQRLDKADVPMIGLQSRAGSSKGRTSEGSSPSGSRVSGPTS